MELSAIITFLVLALVLYLVWWILGKFLPPTPHQIVGVILGIVLLIAAVQRLGLFRGVSL